MTEKIQAVRGMNDILPTQTPYWEMIESACRNVSGQYGYQEIRFPIVEKTGLFKRSIGDATDIVEKEMYTFEDRNGDSLTLRPEGTAGCVRAGIEQGLLYNQIQRLWYLGPMFRHERPQKGRTRQFQQFGVEAFGLKDPDIDAEIILLSKRLWENLGLSDSIDLQINTLGTNEQRANYREALVSYFEKHKDALDEDSLRRLTTNPLRILDSKNPDMQSLIKAAPTLIEYVNGKAKAHFDKLCVLLKALGVPFTINPHLVRGLDYYSMTVFEWVTNKLGAQGTICAGGRYDGLVGQLGGKSTPAIGFAMGLERIALLLEAAQKITWFPDYYLIAVGGDDIYEQALLLAEQIRDHFEWVCLAMNASGGSIKSQFKRADKSGATHAFILGEEELKTNSVTVKNLREQSDQKTFSVEELFTFIAEN